jgi:hypothetical protein
MDAYRSREFNPRQLKARLEADLKALKAGKDRQELLGTIQTHIG